MNKVQFKGKRMVGTVYAGVFFVLLASVFAPVVVRAIECNGVASAQDCVMTEQSPAITGNYRTAIAAIGMYPQESTETITLSVPDCAAGTATIVQSQAYWVLREMAADDINYWDETVDIARDASAPVTVNSDRRYKAFLGAGATAGSSYIADITTAGIVAGGTHTYTITNLDTSAGAAHSSTSQWGFGIHVVYECPEFEVMTIQQTEGLDVHWYGFLDGWDTDRSELICEEFAPSITARTMNLDFFIQGAVDTTLRDADIWYKSDTGAAPGPTDYDLAVDSNTSINGGQIYDRLIFVAEPELESYNNTITIPAGHEYLCLQFDTSFLLGDHPDDPAVRGASMFSGLGWFSYPTAVVSDLTLGDMVWEDSNDNGVLDGSETGICGVDLHLYSDVNGDGAYDVGVEGTTPLAATTSSCGASPGQYSFDSLNPGDYLVLVPDSEFASGQPLYSYESSSAGGAYEPAPDPDNNTDDDDNGSYVAGIGVVATAITLSDFGEPVNDGDTDDNTNLTLDLGFVPAGLRIGNQIFVDANNNGLFDDGESGIAGVVVDLFEDVDNDGLFEPGADDGSAVDSETTNASGNYWFTGIASGDYFLAIADTNTSVTAGTFTNVDLNDYFNSTGGGLIDPSLSTQEPADDNADNNDDGRDKGNPGIPSGYITMSGVISIALGAEVEDEAAPATTSGSDEAEANIETGETVNDDNSNLTIDFGFYLEVFYLTLGLDNNAIDLGVLSPSAINSKSQQYSLTTNNVAGASLYIQGDASGLADGIGNDIDNVSDGDVTPGSEEYGVAMASNITLDTAFASGDNAIPSASTLFASTSLPTIGATIDFTYEAGMDLSTIPGTYEQTITVTAVANP